MAREAGEAEREEDEDGDNKKSITNGSPADQDKDGEDDGSEEEEEEDEEPRLKYSPLTKHLKPVYRNGDATSAFLVAGDKMVTFIATT